MFNTGGASLADIAAVTRNNDGFGDGGGGWWVLIILFFLVGGFGNNQGRNNADLSGEVQRGFDTQTIVSKLDGISNGISSLGYDQLSQMNGVNTNVMRTGFDLQNAINNLSAQQSDCCCQNKTGQMQILNQMGKDTCEITHAIGQAVQQIIQNDNNNYRQLHDEQVQIIMNQKDEKIQEQQSLIQSLSNNISQSSQSDNIVDRVIARLQQCPVGTYNVSNPNCCTNQSQLDSVLALAANLIAREASECRSRCCNSF